MQQRRPRAAKKKKKKKKIKRGKDCGQPQEGKRKLSKVHLDTSNAFVVVGF